MNLLKKLIRDFKINLSSFIACIFIFSLAIASIVGINSMWYSLDKNVNTFYKETNLYDQLYTRNNLTSNDLLDIRNETKVKDANLRYVSNIQYKEDTIKVMITNQQTISLPLVIKGKAFSVNDDGIYLSLDYANANNIKVNDIMNININNTSYQKKVIALILHPEFVYGVKDQSSISPNHNNYGYMIINEQFLKPLDYNQIMIKGNSNKEVINVEQSLSHLQFSREVDDTKSLLFTLPLLFVLIALLIICSFIIRIIKIQDKDIATLLAFGYPKGKLMIHYLSYALVISIIGSLLGYLLGNLLISELLVSTLSKVYSLPSWQMNNNPSNYFLIFIGIIIIIIVTYLIVKNKLRSNIHTLLNDNKSKIIKVKLSKKIPFVVRFNIKDMVNNLTRNLIIILSIAGATILISSALVMKDSFGNLSNWNFKDINKYQYIYPNNDLDIIDSTKVYNQEVKLKDDTYINLKVINNQKMFNYYDTKNKRIKLSGLAMSNIVALKQKLKIGDTFTWYSQLDNKWHKDTIKHIYKTPFEQGITYLETNYDSKVNYQSMYTLNKIEDTNLKPINKAQQIIDYDLMLNSFNSIVLLLVVIAVFMAISVIYTLSSLSFIEKSKNYATLMVLGFRNGVIKKIHLIQVYLQMLIGFAFGISLSYPISITLLKSINDELDYMVIYNVRQSFITFMLIFITTTLTSLILLSKVKHIELVSALKKDDL